MKILSLLENKMNIDDANKAKLDAMFSSRNPQIILLVGLPGSGKSTFTDNYRLKKHGIIASTDDLIEARAKEMGMTYSEAFHKIDFKEVENEMKNAIRDAGKKGTNVIVDQTNMSNKSRASKLDLVPKNYERHAIVFWPEIEVVKARLEKRAKETGKVIPQKVIDSMLANYVPPSDREGFKSVIFVK